MMELAQPSAAKIAKLAEMKDPLYDFQAAFGEPSGIDAVHFLRIHRYLHVRP